MTPRASQRSGSVGDMVPILSAEAAVPDTKVEPPRSQSFHVSDMVPLIQAEAAEPLPPTSTAPPSWQQAPPPRRTQNGEPPRSKPQPPPQRSAPVEQTPPVDDLPVVEALPDDEQVVEALVVDDLPVLSESEGTPPLRELSPGQWEPPPVRRGAGAAVAEPETLDTATHSPDEHVAARLKSRRNRLLIAAILFGMFLMLGFGGGVAWYVMRDTEDKLFQTAQDDYKAKKFASSEGLFKQLADKFPASGRHDEYTYLAQLSGLRNRLTTSSSPVESLDDLQKFFDEHKKDDPFFKQFGSDFGEASTKVLTDFIGNPPIDDTTPDIVAKARTLLAEIKETLGGIAISPSDESKLAEAFVAILKQHADWVYRVDLLKDFEVLAKTPTADNIQKMKRRLKKEEARLPGISQSAEVTQLLDQMLDGQLNSVRYLKTDEEQVRGPREDSQPCILVDANVRGSPSLPEGKVVLALVRGVLYALRHTDGKAVWAMRVGIDTNILPVRVPAVAGSPELILVLSTDTKTLTALDPEQDGKEAWRYTLSEPCLGRPVVVDRRVFLPTYDGQVYEIELSKGKLLGRYQLGQRLTCGGVREGKTPRLYFPADDSCVYVLNVDEHTCEAILYTEHLADTLRGEPLIVGSNNDPKKASGWLILTQKQPLDAVQLRIFELPAQPRKTGELTLKPAARLPGWTWFPPKYDGEKLAMLSDAGVLGLFGIHQERTRDAVLFPFLPGSGALSLDPFLKPHPNLRGRAEVVEVQGNDLWVLGHGQLQRLQLVLDGAKGLSLVPVWKEPVPLGSPLHASQVEIDRSTGRSTLFTVTQAQRFRTSIATAIDDETGEVFWQRQLGLVCQGEPLLLKVPNDDGPPLVLALDQGGGLFAFDPKRFDPKNTDPWQSGGKPVARPLPQNPRIPPLLLPGPDDESAFEIACLGDGQELVIRHVRTDEKRKIKVVRERYVKLEAPLARTPAVSGSVLLLPLADGNLYRLLWKQDEKTPEGSADWRADRAAAEAPGHVVALGNDRYLCTDGSRGLTVFQITEKMWTPLPHGADRPTLQRPDRILGAPLLLPQAPNAAAGALGVWTVPLLPPAPLEVCVADSGNVVALLTLGDDGALKVQREWPLKGRLIAGPFLRRQEGALRLGCVVEPKKGEQRLVWIDPGENEVCWEYSVSGDIVGQPEVIDGLIVLAEESGVYKALDPWTGKAVGPGYEIKGSIVPAASPVSFGSERLFAPLSDGTVMMLSLKQLRER